jgi:hypothetical protein
MVRITSGFPDQRKKNVDLCSWSYQSVSLPYLTTGHQPQRALVCQKLISVLQQIGSSFYGPSIPVGTPSGRGGLTPGQQETRMKSQQYPASAEPLSIDERRPAMVYHRIGVRKVAGGGLVATFPRSFATEDFT